MLDAGSFPFLLMCHCCCGFPLLNPFQPGPPSAFLPPFGTIQSQILSLSGRIGSLIGVCSVLMEPLGKLSNEWELLLLAWVDSGFAQWWQKGGDGELSVHLGTCVLGL